MFPQPSYDFGFLTDETGKVFGFSFGSDATTEHECGLGPLRRAFGVNSPPPPQSLFDKLLRRPKPEPLFGLPARQITQILEGCVIFQKDEDSKEGTSYFLVVTAPRTTRISDEALRRATMFQTDWKTKDRRDKTIASAWCEETAIIRVREQHVEKLVQLAEALNKRDFAFGDTAPGYDWRRNMKHQVGGLCFYIPSRFPQNVAVEWAQKERTEYETQKRLGAWWDKNASDVMPKLRAAKMEWFSLGCDPGNERRRKTRKFIEDEDGTVRVWLNPRHQQDHNCGWFTADDLRDWAKGEGRIMMTPEQKRRA